MTLAELEKSLGIDRIKLGTEPHSLEDINNFGFGEKYQIQYNNGKVIEVKQLDTLLNCMRDEFLMTECWDFDVRMDRIPGSPSRSDPLGQRGPVALCIRPRNVLGRAWTRDINGVCRKLEAYVTYYNLTGQWPENMELP